MKRDWLGLVFWLCISFLAAALFVGAGYDYWNIKIRGMEVCASVVKHECSTTGGCAGSLRCRLSTDDGHRMTVEYMVLDGDRICWRE